MKKSKAITLISLVITIILLIILASVAITLSIGENGIFNRAKETKEKYEVEQIREQVEIGILDSELQRISVNDKLTIEGALQDLVENKIFESIDKQEQLGYIGEYEVKLKYNEDNKVVIEYIQKATGVRATYTLDPVGYTNTPKVNILFKVQGKVKSVTTPKGLIVYPKNEVVGIDYEVTANGRYKFIIEKEDGSIVEKEAIVDTIDILSPKDFEITVKAKTGKIIITANVEDDESETSAKSGIEKIEYFVKLTTASDYTKYDTNEIKGLPSGTYDVYALAYDRVENIPKQSTNTPQVEIEEWVEIWNQEDLIGVREDVSKGIQRNYILMDDIELTQEWKPIGTPTVPFQNKFNGNNKKIANIKIEDEEGISLGLFGKISSEGKVKGLTLQGEIKGKSHIGILVGVNCGTVENVKVEGYVEGSDQQVGGLIGQNTGKVYNCSSDCVVKGRSFLGGLIGHSYNSEIKNIYSKGEVIQLDKRGGDIAGLIGLLEMSTVENTYTISKITKSSAGQYGLGGIFGTRSEQNIKINNSYWSPEITYVDEGELGSKKTAQDMKKQETYEGFDFENIWIMKEYPELRCFQTEE